MVHTNTSHPQVSIVIILQNFIKKKIFTTDKIPTTKYLETIKEQRTTLRNRST